MASSQQPFRWGVVGAGFIARKFTLGLRASEAMSVAAVCTRSQAAAQSFCEPLGIERHFTRYEDFLAAEEIDAVYVATPADTHFELAKAAIEAGRPVLVEKPFCMNASQAAQLAGLAKSRSVFCMEAMWTRFLPLVRELHARIQAGDIGTPRYFFGSFGIAEKQDETNHLLDPARGGGVILDRAVYPVSLASHLLGQPDNVHAELTVLDDNRDVQAAVTLTFPGGCMAQIFASMQTHLENAMTIAGSNAVIDVAPPIYRPYEMSIRPVSASARSHKPIGRADILLETSFAHGLYRMLNRVRRKGQLLRMPYRGNAYVHEANEVMHCVRNGLTQSEVMSLDESVLIMETLDTIRKSGLGDLDAAGEPARVSGAVH